MAINLPGLLERKGLSKQSSAVALWLIGEPRSKPNSHGEESLLSFEMELSSPWFIGRRYIQESLSLRKRSSPPRMQRLTNKPMDTKRRTLRRASRSRLLIDTKLSPHRERNRSDQQRIVPKLMVSRDLVEARSRRLSKSKRSSERFIGNSLANP